jgi:hypothetical protein
MAPVALQVTTYDRLRTGWFSVLVTSYPDKIHEALAASLAVLRELAVSPVTPRELMRAKRTLLTRCDYYLFTQSQYAKPHVRSCSGSELC